MTKIFNLSEAKDQLSSLVDRAASGEEIVIAKHGKPLAKLGPMPTSKKLDPRKPSIFRIPPNERVRIEQQIHVRGRSRRA